MKRFFIYGIYVFSALLILAIGFIVYIKVALPNVGAAEKLTIEYTPERIEHGRYLANTVTVCMDCHSKRDFSKFSGPIVPGTFGGGGEVFDQSIGIPGKFYSKNITPGGVARYSDGELFRVITTGVSKEGKALFPVMPFSYYGRMDKEDIYDIIAYIRSIPSIPDNIPQSSADFPMNIIINTLPHKEIPQTKPSKSDILAYGAYLTNASACAECHTKVNKGQIIPEFIYSGGRDFNFADGTILRSSNITPDKETGIGNWTEEMFIQRFKIYADTSYTSPSIEQGEFNSIMPWMMYSKMDREDLGAIYRYLKSVKSINNPVEKFTARAN